MASGIRETKAIVSWATWRRLTVMRFSVMVPVLSAQITVVEPRVSTAGSRRTSAPERASRQRPAASATVVTAGKPSGIAAIARVMAVSSMSPTGWPRRIPASADDAADPEREADQPAAELLDLPFERRGPLSGEGDQLADPAELRREAGCGRDRQAAPGDHRGPEVHHRAPVGQRGLGGELRVGVLVHRHALAGQGGLGGAETAASDEPRVGRHVASRLQDQQIARNDLGGGDPDEIPLPPNEGLRHRQGAQLRQRDTSPPLGDEPDCRVEEERGQDREGLDMLAERSRNGRSGQKEQDDEAAKLREDETPEGRVGVLAHRVRTDACEPAARFVSAEPCRWIDGQELQDVPGREGVPLTTHRRAPVGGCQPVGRRVRRPRVVDSRLPRIVARGLHQDRAGPLFHIAVPARPFSGT